MSPQSVENALRYDTLLESVWIGGTKKFSADLIHAVTEAKVEYSMDAASTLTLAIFDPKRELLKSGELQPGLRARIVMQQTTKYDVFALTSIGKSGDTITLTFEDEVVYRLRQKRGLKKASRSKVTRAMFIKSLVDELRPAVRFFSPELKQKQPIYTGATGASLQDTDPAGSAGSGFDEIIKIKGKAATAEQKKNLATIIDVGMDLSATVPCIEACICACIEESGCVNLGPHTDTDGLTVSGILQQKNDWPGDARNVANAANNFYQRAPTAGGAIKVHSVYPERPPYWIACEVQRNHSWRANRPNDMGSGSYGRWSQEARAIWVAYLGKPDRYRGSNKVNGDGTVSRARGASSSGAYEFSRGGTTSSGDQEEDSWTAIQRLAGEVGWRAFVYRGIVTYVSDNWLMGRESLAIIDELHPAVNTIDFNIEANQIDGLNISDVSVSVFADTFEARPGRVILITGLGLVVRNIRWLVMNFSRSLFSPVGQMTLASPTLKLYEPTTSGASGGGGSQPLLGANTRRGKLVELARREAARGSSVYSYGGNRPVPTSFNHNKITADCSSWVEMLYHEAGCPSPSGGNFSGFGNTDTQIAKGKKVGNPAPGDLIMYGSGNDPSHVEIVLDNGDCAGFGSQGGPYIHKGGTKSYRSSERIGYYTYNFLDQN